MTKPFISSKEYSDSPTCIYCESQNFFPHGEITDCEVGDNLGLHVPVKCHDCGGDWWETYQLVGFDRYR